MQTSPAMPHGASDSTSAPGSARLRTRPRGLEWLVIAMLLAVEAAAAIGNLGLVAGAPGAAAVGMGAAETDEDSAFEVGLDEAP